MQMKSEGGARAKTARIALRPNPGGQSADYRKDVVGRENLAAFCRRVLKDKSVVLTADRRVGKTWFLKKLGAEAELGADVLWLFAEAEGVSHIGQLLDLIERAARRHLHFKARVFVRSVELLEQLKGKAVGSFHVPGIEGVWKRALRGMMEDLASHAEGKPVILVIDEFPYMLDKIAKVDRQMAMDLLDELRSLRQSFGSSLRMIFAGSIGLHLIVSSLRLAGHHNEPLNDTETVPVPPLDDGPALELAARLLLGARIPDPDDRLAATLVECSGRLPYYLHRLAFEMEKSPDVPPWTPDRVHRLMTGLIEHRDDPLNLAHYRDRIGNYYPESMQPAVFALLEVLAGGDGPLEIVRLVDRARAAWPQLTPVIASPCLELLERDHYLSREGACVRFASPIVRQWWRYRVVFCTGTA